MRPRTKQHLITAAALMAGVTAGVGSLQAATIAYHQAVLNDNPFAYYQLNETAGTTADDASGNNHDGTYVNSPASVAGAGDNSDGAISFNGSNQYVSIGDKLGTFGSQMGNFSVEVVMKTTTTNLSAMLGSINSVGNEGTSGAAGRLWIKLNQTSQGETQFWISNSGGTSDNHEITSDIYDGSYHHIVFTYDGSQSTDNFDVYVDGGLVLSANSTLGTSFVDFANPFILGADYYNGNVIQPADVTLDEVAFYTTTLSADDVATHDAALAAVPEPATGVLILLGLGGLLMIPRRKSCE